ncbi:mitogen-activated protein kinase kinase kinase 7-interacting protein 3 homolog [Schistocerca gregaria]|uniref:mitogen-activated protein kinase kinase kinase 7-interacting protein 3 homolog n=1 Tax=Schistocerca gregaria TaxID=7010 RepID=UPI00211E5927|nr:mitogen-activated protein kinase kinase kinase 7-interacting protein 3 homolog [Schistocerca gregaria]
MAPMQPTCTLPRQQQQQQHSNLVLSMAPFKTPTYGGTDDQQRVVTHPGMQLKGIQKRYPPHPHVPIQMSGKHSNYLVNQQEPSPKAGNNDSGTTFLTSKNNSNYANQQNTSNLSVNYFPPYVESKTPRQQQPSQLPQSKSPHSSPKINVQMPSAVHEKHEYVLTPSILPSTPALYKQEKPSSISMMSPIQKDELAPANQPGNMYQPNSSMSQGAGPERDSGIIDDRKEVRTVRNRRGGHINYNDEYYYNGDGTFEDSIEDKPKRKRRRMSSKSKK